MEELIRINHNRSKPTSQSPAADVALSDEERDSVCVMLAVSFCADLRNYLVIINRVCQSLTTQLKKRVTYSQASLNW